MLLLIVFLLKCVAIVHAFNGNAFTPLSLHHTNACPRPASLSALSGAEVVVDPSFNLAAGALVAGTISGGLADVF